MSRSGMDPAGLAPAASPALEPCFGKAFTKRFCEGSALAV